LKRMKSRGKWKHGKSNAEKVRRKEEARAINVHDAAATMASKHIGGCLLPEMVR